MRIWLLLVALATIYVPAAFGQPETNTEVYQLLAVDCFGELPADISGLKLTAPLRMQFIRSALVSRWTEPGRRVYLADSAYSGMPDDLPHFSYNIEKAAVTYGRIKKKRITRTVDLELLATFNTSAGEILIDETCKRKHADTLSVADLNDVETSSYPETQAPHPRPGWVRRALEPVVLTAATVVGVYLFFTLRSESSEDGS